MVAIALATYNPNPKFFQLQINSLINQTFSDWKCYLYDDYSNDQYWDFIFNYLRGDSRFIISRGNKNVGVFAAFENALLAIPNRVNYIALCDQDDIWYPKKIECLLENMKNSKKSLVHSDLSLIDEHNNIIKNSCWKAEGRITQNIKLMDLIFKNVVTGCSCLFTREVLNRSLPFPKLKKDNLPFYHDLWIALNAVNLAGIESINEPLTHYRQHAANIIGSNKKGFGFSKSFLYRCKSQYKSRICLIDELSKNKQIYLNFKNEFRNLQSPFFLFVHCFKYFFLSPKMLKTLVMIFLGRFLFTESKKI